MSRTTPENSQVAGLVSEKGDGGTEPEAEERVDGTSTDEDTSAYLDGWAVRFLGMALMGSGFMLSLDNTILCMHV